MSRNRRAALAAAAAFTVAFPAAGARAAERCCFLVQAEVSGSATWTVGRDLERPGAYAYRLRWRWTARHLARYVEHGRIFNALTAPRAQDQASSSLAVRLAETRTGIHGVTCRHQVNRRLLVPRARAFVSLEDTTAGKIALVVRAHNSLLRSRCARALVIPRAHVAPAPAGITLRRAAAITLAWCEEITRAPAGLRGAVCVRVQLSSVPEMLAGNE